MNMRSIKQICALSLSATVLLSLMTPNAYAWLPKISEGQVFAGTTESGKSCSVEILRITNYFDESSHCMGVTIRSSFDPDKEVYLVTQGIYGVESTLQPGQKSCAEALTADANPNGPDAENIWIRTISNNSHGPDHLMSQKYSSYSPIYRSFTMTFDQDGDLIRYERYGALDAALLALIFKSKQTCNF